MADQLPRHNFRRLAPRIGTEAPTTSRSPEDARTKRASAACGECKHRRTKCVVDASGGPCTECAFHKRQCIIDEMADKRRKIAAKETEELLRKTQIELAETQIKLLEAQQRRIHWHTYAHYLVSTLRFCDITDVHGLIGLARGGSSDGELQRFCSRFAHLFPHLDQDIGSQYTDSENGTLSRNDSQQ
ncbi:hypothetical protein BDV12DRAFT_82525 [Aspergillus spectabilis]